MPQLAKMNAPNNGGLIMRVGKVGILSLAVALAVASSVPLASAKPAAKMKLPPGACAFEKKAVNAGAICSHQCNAQTNWCAQQLCTNGTLVQVLPCFGPFCTAKCS
jgi:hypothetical protein